MNTRHTLFGTSLSLAMIAMSHGDMKYQSVSLSAEAYCQTTQDIAASNEKVLSKSGHSATAACGETFVSAYFNPGKGQCSMAAGSTGPSAQPQEGEGWVLTDNSAGYAAVEVEFEIDIITCFTMSRCLEGSVIEIWQEDNLMHSFKKADDAGALLPGKYQFKMENNPFEEPAWAEVTFEQASGIAGDIDNNGVLDQRDLVEMVEQIRKGPGVAAKPESAKRKPSLESQKRRPRCGNEFGQDASKPQTARRKARAAKSKAGSGPAVENRGGEKRPDWSDATPIDKLPANFADDGRSNSINAADAKAQPEKGSKRPAENAISIERLQGDMDGDEQITMMDLAELLGQL